MPRLSLIARIPGDITNHIKTFDHLPVPRNTGGVHINIKATHTIVITGLMMAK